MPTQMVELFVQYGGIDICNACKSSGGPTIVMTVKFGDKQTYFNICMECCRTGLGIRIPFWIPGASTPNYKKKARKGEIKTAKEIKGEVHCGSGAFDRKGDCSNEKWMVEEKSTTSSGFRLTTAVIEKAIAQAVGQGKKALIKLRLPKLSVGIFLWGDALELIDEGSD